jgi:hypothetical protein
MLVHALLLAVRKRTNECSSGHALLLVVRKRKNECADSRVLFLYIITYHIKIKVHTHTNLRSCLSAAVLNSIALPRSDVRTAIKGTRSVTELILTQC